MHHTNLSLFIFLLLFLLCPLSSSLSSYICPLDYFFDLQHCQSCLPNCKCTQKDTCSSCIPGYTMFKGTCIQCPQSNGIYGSCSSCCSKTTGTQLTCTDCEQVTNAYTFLYSGRCIVSPGCFQIDNDGFCRQCFPGYYQQNNLCYTCHSSCQTCTDITNCLSCASGYFWSSSSSGGLCTSCPLGCSTCDSSSTCYNCLSHYYLFQTNCLACPIDCSGCTDGSTCTQCSVGILVSNLCVRCTATTYQGSIGCVQCVGRNNFIECLLCDDGYFLDANGVCQQCSDYINGAVRCTSGNTPTQCMYDYNVTLGQRYYLVGITCIKNSKNCRKIADVNANCSSCYQGYTLATGTCYLCDYTGCKLQNRTVVGNVCVCTQCMQGYYLNSSNLCQACTVTNCASCPADVCATCISGYYLSGVTCLVSTATNCLTSSSAGACQTCQWGYYKGSDNLCYSCQSTCKQCINRYSCSKCLPNNYLDGSTGSCIGMPVNCVEIGVGGCLLCEHGYYLYEGYCVACRIQLGTLKMCRGLCPIDYYIQSLVVLNSWNGIVGAAVAMLIVVVM